jgi:RHS repeat-associated protein
LFHRADYQILYDTLNHRVETTVGSTVTDFVFNAGGQRVSEWNASTHAQLKGHYYWGSKPVAYYTTASDGGAAVHFEHQDWLGTERMRTAYNGSVEGSYASLPYGDGQTASGTDTDANHVAMLDFDSESDTDHAKYRQYSPTEGRWLRPDPYSGSYHFRNPQSMNRYVYAMNSPLSKIDPSGLDNEWSPDEGGGYFGFDGGGGGYGGPGGFESAFDGLTVVTTVYVYGDADTCDYSKDTGCVVGWESYQFNLQGEAAQNAVFAQVDSRSGNGGNGAPNNGEPAKPPLTPQQQKTCHDLNVYSKKLVLTGGATAGVGGLMTLGTITAPAGAIVAGAGGVVALAGGIVDLWAYEVCN